MIHEIKKGFQWIAILFVIFLVFVFSGCKSTETNTHSDTSSTGMSIETIEYGSKEQTKNEIDNDRVRVEKELSYSIKDKVAAYIHEFNELPPNYITKKEAQDLWWDNSKGNLWQVTEKKSIGGDRFGNREDLLQEANHRQYFECDINYQGGYRGDE